MVVTHPQKDSVVAEKWDPQDSDSSWERRLSRVQVGVSQWESVVSRWGMMFFCQLEE